MASEIERRWLVAESKLPRLDQFPSSPIAQGYLTFLPDGVEVRLRKKGERFYETVKIGGDLSRDEYEIELTPEQFAVIWPATLGRRMEKTRYKIPYAEYTIELDMFEGKLKGLSIAEVEFPSLECAHAFIAPEWFGEEVTFNKRYRSKELVLEGLPEGE